MQFTLPSSPSASSAASFLSNAGSATVSDDTLAGTPAAGVPGGFADVLAGIAPSPTPAGASAQPGASPTQFGALANPAILLSGGITTMPTLVTGEPVSADATVTSEAVTTENVGTMVQTGSVLTDFPPTKVSPKNVPDPRGSIGKPTSSNGSSESAKPEKGLSETSDALSVAVAANLVLPVPAALVAVPTVDLSLQATDGAEADLDAAAVPAAVPEETSTLGDATTQSFGWPSGAVLGSRSYAKVSASFANDQGTNGKLSAVASEDSTTPAQNGASVVAPVTPQTMKLPEAATYTVKLPVVSTSTGEEGVESAETSLSNVSAVDPQSIASAPTDKDLSASNQAAPVIAVSQATEKIAAQRPVTATPVKAGSKVDSKSILSAERKTVTNGGGAIGTPTAKTPAVMPSGSTYTRSTEADTSSSAAVAQVIETKGNTDAGTLASHLAPTSTTHRAVEAALNAAERVSAREQHSVSLQFNVGGNDLNVRVQMKDGEVQATFRTDSAELRAALSNEWREVAGQSNRASRMADPVFAGSTDAGSNFSGDTTRQRQQDSSSGSATYQSSFVSTTRGPSSADGAVAVSTSANSVASENSVHLHTFA